VSKIIASAAIRGAHKIVERAEKKYKEALEKWGPNQEVGFPNTAYYLPVIYAMLGIPVKTVSDMKPVLDRCRNLFAAPRQRKRCSPLPGTCPRCRDGNVLCGGNHRSGPLPGGTQLLYQTGGPAS